MIQFLHIRNPLFLVHVTVILEVLIATYPDIFSLSSARINRANLETRVDRVISVTTDLGSELNDFNTECHGLTQSDFFCSNNCLFTELFD